MCIIYMFLPTTRVPYNYKSFLQLKEFLPTTIVSSNCRSFFQLQEFLPTTRVSSNYKSNSEKYIAARWSYIFPIPHIFPCIFPIYPPIYSPIYPLRGSLYIPHSYPYGRLYVISTCLKLKSTRPVFPAFMLAISSSTLLS